MFPLLILTHIGAIRYDDALNGAEAAPSYEPVIASAPMPMSPAGGAADFAAIGGTPKSTPRAVLLAWLLLLAILIVAHVLTISVQR